ncbi:CapA family protein [Plebeiibacterium sediminum]|uniref:CapA family protein n=1 Tax=Plebeiibacterium sediminum TaxID=2992112 RepID=A0AAE3SHL8_9BACT|nr:CapA family protein [Plebeiobacterium sediminum]MCW3788253.1 CapA family protein [Plebeiobacterium sediminum]
MKKLIIISLLYFCIISIYAQDTTTVSFVFVGDVMGHDTQINSAYNENTGKYDYSGCFKYVSNIFDDADFTIANLEVTLAGPPFKGYPQFSSPDALAVAMKDAGIDAMVTANNHCIDRRKQGLERTIDVLDSLNIPHTGTFKDSLDKENQRALILEKNGIKVAILNYTYGTNGIAVTIPNIVNYIDEEVIKNDIEKTKAFNPDKIIAFVHWGLEYETSPNQDQIKINKLFKDNGVDVVIGSHPHVVQPIKYTEDEFVVYSLGNFISNQRTAPRDGGVMVKVELSKTKNSTFVSDAGYYLTWVYTPKINDKKEFYILPVSPFERDALFMNEEANNRLIEYGKEARDIFKSNVNISEYFFNENLPGWNK